MDTKPHRGSLQGWHKEHHPDCPGLGFIIRGRFVDHPYFGGQTGHTSWVEKFDAETGEIETRNSRYTLVGDETVLEPRPASPLDNPAPLEHSKMLQMEYDILREASGEVVEGLRWGAAMSVCLEYLCGWGLMTATGGITQRGRDYLKNNPRPGA